MRKLAALLILPLLALVLTSTAQAATGTVHAASAGTNLCTPVEGASCFCDTSSFQTTPAGNGYWDAGHFCIDANAPGGASLQYRLVLQTDGNLVLSQISQGVTYVIWSSGTYGHPDDSMWAQTDGDLVIYGSTSLPDDPLWASHVASPSAYYILQGTDGNFVAYTPAGHALWSTKT